MIFKTFALVALAASFALAGPVSYYGKLTAKDGYLYGAKTGTTQVQVKGMSLFWNTWDVGYNFYKASVVDSLVSKWKVEILRVAHGTGTNLNSSWQSLDDAVIQEAINKDIYVIIDYHSHTAQNEVSEATTFFTYMAKKWGSYPNVIFEVFNEPNSKGMWSSVKSYANTIIPVIRQYSSNLIIVGNSEYSAHPEEAISDPVTDSGNNTAYTFHFYADSHALDGGDYDGYATFRNRIRNAIQAGRTIFVTEWGTTNADGGISTSNVNTSSSDTWLTFLDNNKISWCNWSVSNKSEASAAFMGQSAYTNPTNWEESGYSTSGKYVYAKLQAWATSAAWKTGATSSSSSAVSSSSQAAGTTDYIDDFEDGDKYAFTGGVWYAYTDKGDKGTSSLTNKTDDGDYVVVQSAGTGNSTKYMAGMNGVVLSQGENEYDPYVALGINLNEDESDYDLSKCSTISYKYKGAAHSFKAQMSTITNYNYHATTFVAKGDWTSVTISWDDLTQADWGDTKSHVAIDKTKVNKFAWEIKEDAGTQPDYNYLWIDDVKCNGIGIKPVASPSSSSKANSSSSAKSSSSVTSSSSTVKSSSSVASSSSTVKSSSSVASSSSTVKSSSSVASSSSSVKSSSSVTVSSSATAITPTGTWASTNTTLTNNTATGVSFGQSQDYNSDRVVNYAFATTAGTAYTVTYSAVLSNDGSLAMTSAIGGSSTKATLTTTAQTITNTFTATAATSTLTLTVAGGNWQTVAISGLTITASGSTTVIADNTRVNAIPLHASHNGVEFTLNESGIVKLQVFDMLGHAVENRTESLSAGTHGVKFNNITQGNYIVRVQAQGKSSVTRMQVR